MALEMPESGFVWLKVPLQGEVRCTVVGEVHTWWSHWQRMPGGRGVQAVRCARAVGVACAWCDAGFPRRARYVFPVRVEGEVRVVEVGRVQYPTLKLLVAEGFTGRVLRLKRTHAAKNAEIQMFPAGKEHVSDESLVCCEEFVSNLGVGQLKLLQPPTPVPPSERSRSEEVTDELPRRGRR